MYHQVYLQSLSQQHTALLLHKMKAPITSRTTSIIGTYFMSTDTERRNGRLWYPAAHTAALDISGEYQVSVITAAGVIAALSPNNRWHRNLIDAPVLIQVFTSSGAEHASRVKVCTYSANLQKALTILKLQSPTVEDVATVLNGRKITSFFRCILGDEDSVCVDGHAFAIWQGSTLPTRKAPAISPRLYAQIQDDYREAARLINNRDGHGYRVTPAQLQAITWVTHRRLRDIK
jgi:hypothetical protein